MDGCWWILLVGVSGTDASNIIIVNRHRHGGGVVRLSSSYRESRDLLVFRYLQRTGEFQICPHNSATIPIQALGQPDVTQSLLCVDGAAVVVVVSCV